MKKPSFQFYPADWRNNAKLRRCTWEARGAWLEVMCLFHDSEEYGLLRWTLKELAQAIGAPVKLIKELADKGVLKGGDKTHEALIYTPRSGRVDGDPITLIAGDVGACWYSSRMVIDEHIRQKKGESTRFTSSQNQPPNPSPKGGIGEGLGAAPKPSPNTSPHGRQGDGSTSSSSTTYKNNKNNTHTIHPQGCVSDFEKNPKAAEEVVDALAALGFESVSPTHPALNALLAKGVTLGQFIEAGGIARKKNKDFSYLIGVVGNQIAEANAIGAAPGMPEPDWELHGGTIRAKAKEIGFEPWAGDGPTTAVQPEPFVAYTARLRVAVEALKAVTA
jgi:hypothetical protein